jgi:hypothetical protein
MVARDDREHDIAAWFGVNQGRIAEVKGGSHGTIRVAQAQDLPPKGPPGPKGRRLRGAVGKALDVLAAHAEPFLDTTSDFAEIVFAILGVAAKLERRRIVERATRGRADAKAKGVKFGRKPKLTTHQQREAQKRIAAGETQRSIACSYNVSQATISRIRA